MRKVATDLDGTWNRQSKVKKANYRKECPAIVKNAKALNFLATNV